MKLSTLCTLVFAAFCLLSLPQQAQAQYVYGYDEVGYDSNARYVYGYGATYLDYYAGYYYDPEVSGLLFKLPENETPIRQGYGYGYDSTYPAEVYNLSSLYRASTTYEAYSTHFVRSYYSYNYCFNCWYDPLGYSFFSGGGGYGGYYPWYSSFFNPNYYVSGRRKTVGWLSVRITTPPDSPPPPCGGSASGYSASVTANAPCPPPPPPPTPTPTPPGTISIEISATDIRPAETGGQNTASVTVRTNPADVNKLVTLRLEVIEHSGGHEDAQHTGLNDARPRGRLRSTQGRTDASGAFQTTYMAPIFNGRVKITAKVDNAEVGNFIDVKVDGLQELGPGENYLLVGEKPWHPLNHWGTPEADTSLVHIANDYKVKYHPQEQEPMPENEKLRYNDQSLPQGGKFDIHHDWSPAHIDHDEHRVGINCDVRASDVPLVRREELLTIFRTNGSTRTGDEVRSRNHWHLRFLYEQSQSAVTRSSGTFIEEAWGGALGRAPNDSEWQDHANSLSNAQAQGQSQTLSQARALERSLFQSPEYINLNRSDEEFVTNLYTAYLLREPDEGGYNYWLDMLHSYNAQGLNGREYLLQGFEYSTEFADLVGALEAMPSDPPPTSCDPVQEQNCYNGGGSWDSGSCSCIY